MRQPLSVDENARFAYKVDIDRADFNPG